MNFRFWKREVAKPVLTEAAKKTGLGISGNAPAKIYQQDPNTIGNKTPFYPDCFSNPTSDQWNKKLD